MLTTDALKKLYVAMGGTASDVENLTLTPELIDAIAEIYSGGGSSLPAVTSDDNGKALLVQEGAWDKGAIPSNKFIATYTPNETMTSATCDKTHAQILAAYNAGKDIWAKFMLSADLFGIAPLSSVLDNSGSLVFGFGSTMYNTEQSAVLNITGFHKADGTIPIRVNALDTVG